MKTRYKLLIICILLVGSFNLTVAEDDKQDRQFVGYISGDDFLKMSNNHKLTYTIGLLDGIQVGVDLRSMCLAEMKPSQLQAILEKYLKDHPEKWHYSMSSNAMIAWSNACKAK